VLEIPAIDFRAYVLEGTTGSVLAKGPGHYPGTPLPGDSGNSAIAGHRTMHGHPFHDLDLLQPGDEIFTGTAECTAVYRVVEVIIVYPSDTSVVAQTGADRLTLTTCHPKGSASRRLVVVAEPTG
jgi:sortase A